jgi:N-formylglutamate amidohydrolase
MTLPIGLSVPHAGLGVPHEIAGQCLLTPDEIREDGDVGARAIYDLSSEVAAFETTGVARAIVDLNRSEADRRADGVVKTHTCWNVPVYRTPLSEAQTQALLAAYYHPYHRRLEAFASLDLRVAIDCHTMAAEGPPVGPDPGAPRPWICLGNGDGGTCPDRWIHALAEAFRKLLGGPVAINAPFRGGYITRHHSERMPWLQLEISRAPFLSEGEKREVVLEGLRAWIRGVESGPGRPPHR